MYSPCKYYHSLYTSANDGQTSKDFTKELHILPVQPVFSISSCDSKKMSMKVFLQFLGKYRNHMVLNLDSMLDKAVRFKLPLGWLMICEA